MPSPWKVIARCDKILRKGREVHNLFLKKALPFFYNTRSYFLWQQQSLAGSHKKIAFSADIRAYCLFFCTVYPSKNTLYNYSFKNVWFHPLIDNIVVISEIISLSSYVIAPVLMGFRPTSMNFDSNIYWAAW